MIRKLLVALRDFLWGPRTTRLPSPDLFPALDLPAVRKELQVSELGRRNGAQDLPPAEATDLDHAEREVVSFFQEQISRAAGLAVQHQQVFETSILSLGGDTAIARLRSISERAVGDLSTLGRNGRNLLHSEIQQARALANDLARFKAQNGLSREPRYPESRVWAFAVVSVAALVETAANGMLFARGAQAGLVGGVAQALLFSVANVVWGFLAGKTVLTNLKHVRVWRRLAASLGAVVYIGGGVALALMVSHYRDALAEPQPDQMAVAWIAFLARPWHFSDIGSVVLVGVSALCSLVAANEGFRIDDQYPGFGEAHRLAEQAHQRYASELDQLSAQASELRDRAQRELELVVKEAQLHEQQRQSLTGKLSSLRSRFEQHENYLENTMQVLLREYRAANQSVRTAQAPAYFDGEVPLRRVSLPNGQAAESQATGPVGAVLGDAASAVNRACNDALQSFKTVEQLTAGEV